MGLLSQASQAFTPAASVDWTAAGKQKQVDSVLSNQTQAVAPRAATKASPADRINPKAQYGDRGGEKRIDTKGMTKPLGSFKKGGKVKKTGVYKLHKGERVATKKDTAKIAKKGGLAAVLGGRKIASDNDGDE